MRPHPDTDPRLTLAGRRSDRRSSRLGRSAASRRPRGGRRARADRVARGEYLVEHHGLQRLPHAVEDGPEGSRARHDARAAHGHPQDLVMPPAPELPAGARGSGSGAAHQHRVRRPVGRELHRQPDARPGDRASASGRADSSSRRCAPAATRARAARSCRRCRAPMYGNAHRRGPASALRLPAVDPADPATACRSRSIRRRRDDARAPVACARWPRSRSWRRRGPGRGRAAPCRPSRDAAGVADGAGASAPRGAAAACRETGLYARRRRRDRPAQPAVLAAVPAVDRRRRASAAGSACPTGATIDVADVDAWRLPGRHDVLEGVRVRRAQGRDAHDLEGDSRRAGSFATYVWNDDADRRRARARGRASPDVARGGARAGATHPGRRRLPRLPRLGAARRSSASTRCSSRTTAIRTRRTPSRCTPAMVTLRDARGRRTGSPRRGRTSVAAPPRIRARDPADARGARLPVGQLRRLPQPREPHRVDSGSSCCTTSAATGRPRRSPRSTVGAPGHWVVPGVAAGRLAPHRARRAPNCSALVYRDALAPRPPRRCRRSAPWSPTRRPSRCSPAGCRRARAPRGARAGRPRRTSRAGRAASVAVNAARWRSGGSGPDQTEPHRATRWCGPDRAARAARPRRTASSIIARDDDPAGLQTPVPGHRERARRQHMRARLGRRVPARRHRRCQASRGGRGGARARGGARRLVRGHPHQPLPPRVDRHPRAAGAERVALDELRPRPARAGQRHLGLCRHQRGRSRPRRAPPPSRRSPSPAPTPC